MVDDDSPSPLLSSTEAAPMFPSCRISTTTLSSPSWFPSQSDYPSCRRFPKPALPSLKIARCSLGIQDTLRQAEAGDVKSDLRIPIKGDEGEREDVGTAEEEAEVEEHEKGVSGIDVPRQRYIAVSKSELLKEILLMFDSQEERDQFLLLSSCLDSILHAEHKSILEEMRLDYDLTHIMEKKEPGHDSSEDSGSEIVANANISGSTVENTFWNESAKEHTEEKIGSGCPLSNSPDLRYLLGFPQENVKKDTLNKSRVAVATRFQRAFVKLLYDAQFEELSARDLMLTSTLNSDYLLTLPIYVDWKRASESNAIIFRRGYATEKQKGLLIVEKLDYLQSKLLQGIFFNISKPLGKFLSWMIEAFRNAIQGQDSQVWAEKVKVWLTERIILQQSYSYSEQTSDNLLKGDQLSDNDLPIWLAAQSAITRYEGILSQVGPRRRLLRKLFTWIGLLPPIPREQSDLETDASSSEPYLRPIFLSRRTLSDIWEPATKNRCGNDFWKMLKTSFSILFSRAVLQEPTFQELIFLFTEERGSEETEDQVEVPSLQLKIKIFENISIPDLPVIFPHKKLSFRILDTVRLDIATVLGLLAFFINYRFENISSSPSAIYLDAIAVSALILAVTRVILGYKQTWDRYQLLVNKTLYEKTLASGFGTVHFLLDASEQQQYKEAILAYAVLLKAKTSQVTCPQQIKDKCERFMYNSFKAKVEMPVDKAMDTLIRLGLVVEKIVNEFVVLQAVPCHEACDILRRRWHSMIPNSASI